MRIIQQLKSMIGASPPEESYEYYCTVCHTTFDSTIPDAEQAGCESCGSTKVEPA